MSRRSHGYGGRTIQLPELVVPPPVLLPMPRARRWPMVMCLVAITVQAVGLIILGIYADILQERNRQLAVLAEARAAAYTWCERYAAKTDRVSHSYEIILGEVMSSLGIVNGVGAQYVRAYREFKAGDTSGPMLAAGRSNIGAGIGGQ